MNNKDINENNLLKEDFLKMISKYEEDVANFLLNNNNRLILIKGVKFIGKTSIIKKIYEKYLNYPVIYHTGCAPQKRNIANKYFISILNQYKEKKCLVLLDEFYYEQNCQYFIEHENFRCLLFVNSLDLNIKGFKNFYLLDTFEIYKEKFFKQNSFNDWEDINIRDLIFLMDNSTFDKKDFEVYTQRLEMLRSYSNVTQTLIKEGKKEKKQKIIFDHDKYEIEWENA